MKRIPLNRKSIEYFVFFILIYIIWFITAYNVRKTDIEHSSLLGVVNDVHTNYRNKSEVYIKFKDTDKLNQLSLLFNDRIHKDKNILLKGDSICKKMFTQGYDVYRKIDKEYVFLYHIDSKK